MKRKVVITLVLVASMMVSAVPAFAVKAEAKPERTASVMVEANPEIAKGSPGPTMPELPEVPFAIKAEAKPE
ncbi:hypothetical protein [Paenibacillus roseipurpureus]|uniref:Uncharacterized protein n=1 Tax=Paenibacillus roseopurpureus TaxID=2918901 RepID=A0AA96RII9_9BACL|nr:hypothetical protein [Paenibacillus sp. MBLB1832]WNR44358.1 hypothetical protein MJB10_25400 [Paenibacillus sp. MBLB1832]